MSNMGIFTHLFGPNKPIEEFYTDKMREWQMIAAAGWQTMIHT